MGMSGDDGGNGADGSEAKGGGDVGEAVDDDWPRQNSDPSDTNRISLAPVCDMRRLHLTCYNSTVSLSSLLDWLIIGETSR